MKIVIEYEASWRNSFLDGSNNEPLPNDGRTFIGSMTTLKTAGNFKSHVVNKNTVMGVLNRLIGDQRKLYQARQDGQYYFKEIEQIISDSDIIDKANIQNEVVYLRNISGSTDQNAFTGMIRANDMAFNSDFSKKLWGVLWLSFEEIITFIQDSNFPINYDLGIDPFSVIEQLEFLNSEKPINLSEPILNSLNILKEKFSDVDYKLTKKNQLMPITLYASALYLQIDRLKQSYDLSCILTKSGGLSGVSKRGFTKKDFMDRYTTGAKKLIWGNPYILEERKKGEGKVIQTLVKSNGTLEINLNISKEQAFDLHQKILNAGVSSFYLGKKGLAYVTDIRL